MGGGGVIVTRKRTGTKNPTVSGGGGGGPGAAANVEIGPNFGEQQELSEEEDLDLVAHSPTYNSLAVEEHVTQNSVLTGTLSMKSEELARSSTYVATYAQSMRDEAHVGFTQAQATYPMRAEITTTVSHAAVVLRTATVESLLDLYQQSPAYALSQETDFPTFGLQSAYEVRHEATIVALGIANFSSSGVWTVPTGVTSFTARVWGGGAGGGDGSVQPGGGGGGGAFTETTGCTATGGTTVTVSVAIASTGAGVDSFIRSSSTCLARGGTRGVNGGITSGGSGGAGGSSASGVGSLKRSGGNGAAGGSAGGGGGGGGAGSSGNGGNAASTVGGSSGSGFGGPGGNGAPALGGAGNPGTTNGGAGGGGALVGNAGGAGARGFAQIIWVMP